MFSEPYLPNGNCVASKAGGNAVKCRFWTPPCKLPSPSRCSSNFCLAGCRNHSGSSLLPGENHVALCSRWIWLHPLCRQLSTGRGSSGKSLSPSRLQGSCVCFAHRVCVSGWKQQMRVSLLSPLASESELFQAICWRRWPAHSLVSRRGWCGGKEGIGFLLTLVG